MITLMTSVWEKNINSIDWFLNFKHPLVTEKILVINNLNGKNIIQDLTGIKVIYSDDYIGEVNDFFKIGTSTRSVGHYYAIQYYVAILKATNPYLLSVPTDCTEMYTDDFMSGAIQRLEVPGVIFTDNRKETKVFADHLWMAKVAELKKIDYNTKFEGDFTPAYGGESFEKRVSCYLHTTNNFINHD